MPVPRPVFAPNCPQWHLPAAASFSLIIEFCRGKTKQWTFLISLQKVLQHGEHTVNELEVYQALLSTIEYAQGTGEMMFTLMTGYLLVAFFIGEKLTIFQVLFVNTTYLMMYGAAASTMVDAMGKVDHFRVLLDNMGSEIPLDPSYIQGGFSSQYYLWLVPLLVISGYLYFMWSIRHPKAQ
jgi:hypothetical protein